MSRHESTPHKQGDSISSQIQLSPKSSLSLKGGPRLRGPQRRNTRSPEREPDTPRAKYIQFDGRRREDGGWEQPWRVTVSGALRVAAVVLLVVLVGAAGSFAGWMMSKDTLRIPHRPFHTQPYHHLDFSAPISLAPATRVIHVTKEFGPATMGGLGVMLTALAIAQSESPYLSVEVILPRYSFLRDHPEYADKLETFTQLPVYLHSPKSDQRERINCRVSLLRWEYTPAADFLDPDVDLDAPVEKQSINIFLIGPGDQYPFKNAFKATDAGDIYSAYRPLKQEWKDLWFAKAAAELVAFLSYSDSATIFDRGVADDLTAEETSEAHHSSFTPTDPRKGGVDVVHLHGATNAMVAFYLREMDDFDVFGEDPPAIVYTLHDSLDEVEYSNLLVNTKRFTTPTVHNLHDLSTYTYGKQVFTSAIGIDLSNMVTFVSESIAASIVEGRFNFSLRDLVMPSIAARASDGAFVGITNGLDFTELSRNPFASPVLLARHLTFPRVGPNVSDSRTLWTASKQSGRSGDSGLTAVSFSHSKEKAKEYLIENLPGFFSQEDLRRPFFLFIGRFQYNKGCQFFEPFLKLISSAPEAGTIPLDARLIVMGARNNYPHASLLALQKKYPRHFTFIDDLAFQESWGTIIRMASDFAYVPSFSEAFGLVAAEGLLFGMPVVSTGIGGLAEFLEPLSEDGKKGNAFLFSLRPDLDAEGVDVADYGVSAENSRMSLKELEPAIASANATLVNAIRSWKKRNDAETTGWVERELFVRRMVADALKLKWSREKGPIEEYVRVYDMAMARRHWEPIEEDPDEVVVVPTLEDELKQQVLDQPNIAHGGHDMVTGEEGLEALLAGGAPASSEEDDEEAEEDPEEHADHVAELPIYKVWTSDPEGEAKRKAALLGGGGKKKKPAKKKGGGGKKGS
ncbi:glycogen/starch synthase, ADP-glucose type, glycosyltransferase family 5 protein [Pseudohyphozyma bogoriensis]|nr:glycogen/starch synthase, ADP-glucose type, glycosyltransferase family 5 protein [Pseudohyphozyma bogoriensis]